MKLIPLSEETIREAFQGKTEQAEVVIALYRIPFPNWDNITKIDGWPSVSENTWKFICKQFLEFDRIHHPDVMAGGCWMNNGFAFAAMSDWVIDVSSAHVEEEAA